MPRGDPLGVTLPTRGGRAAGPARWPRGQAAARRLPGPPGGCQAPTGPLPGEAGLQEGGLGPEPLGPGQRGLGAEPVEGSHLA